MTPRTERAIAVVLGIFLLFAVGCGGSGEEPGSSDGETQSPTGETETEDLTPAEKWKQVKLPKPVPEMDEDLVDKGKELYHGRLACVSCHGPNGTGNGPAAASLTNTETGEPISPRNFQNPENFKWDSSREGIARTILTGGKNPGSPMPPMKGTVSREELWAVASYVYQFRNQSSEDE